MIKIFITELLKENEIIKQLTIRDIASKYKGSKLGFCWAAINPLLMLSIYTLIFSQVFRARWGNSIAEPENPIYFGLNIFCGLIIFNMYAECMARGPRSISSNPNYVKKIIFPLSTLGVTVVGSTLMQAIINCVALIIIQMTFLNNLPLTVIAIPFVWLPVIVQLLGITWFLSVIGIFIRDVEQITNALISALMFMSPIFYPSEALPESIRWISAVNPLTYGIEQTRNVMIKGNMTPIENWIVHLGISLVICQGAYWLLKRTRKYFGDLL